METFVWKGPNFFITYHNENDLVPLGRQTHTRRHFEPQLNWSCWCLNRKTFLPPYSSATFRLRTLDGDLCLKRSELFYNLSQRKWFVIYIALLNAITSPNYAKYERKHKTWTVDWNALRGMKTTNKANLNIMDMVMLRPFASKLLGYVELNCMT